MRIKFDTTCFKSIQNNFALIDKACVHFKDDYKNNITLLQSHIFF